MHNTRELPCLEPVVSMPINAIGASTASSRVSPKLSQTNAPQTSLAIFILLLTLFIYPVHCSRGILQSSPSTMPYSLPDLPYAFDALEPYVDAETMKIHHDKHHQAYVNNLNNALAKHTNLQSFSLEDLNAQVGQNVLPQDVETAIRNNGGGHFNHAFFWKVMSKPVGDASGPSKDLKDALEGAFGSVDNFKKVFNETAAARFGSGWAWLVMDGEGKLNVTSTPNQDNPLQKAVVQQAGTPLLALDVWEHAYYLKYQNRRPEYISAWWNVVNWEQVIENYEQAKQTRK